MPKEIDEIALITYPIDKISKIPLSVQLYNLLRKNIMEGRLLPGQKLPGTRTLSGELEISRNTVSAAFNQLLIEGYIKGKIGSGTFVNVIPETLLQANKHNIKKTLKEVIPQHLNNFYPGENKKESDRYKNLPAATKKSKSTHVINSQNLINITTPSKICTSIEELLPFQTGVPALNHFPIKTWIKLINQVSRSTPINHLGYGDAAGYNPLREEIATYLRTYRAVKCSAGQLIIINGSQQGLDLAARLLLTEKKIVWLEDPGYLGAQDSFFFSDAVIYPIPIDNEGINLDAAMRQNPIPNLIYTTPSHQFPMGVTMSISRRLALLQYAGRNNSWIIEDDYDSEFRYEGNPLPSLQGMDNNRKVIYIGTFSKVMFPGLRLGYLVLPDESMVNTFVSAKYLIDRQCPIFEQIVLAKFIREGYFTRHIRKMRMLYKARQDFLVTEVNKQLSNLVSVNASPAGMHIILWLNEHKFKNKSRRHFIDKEISNEAVIINLIIKPLSDYSNKYFTKPALILGYTAFNDNEIKRGITSLKIILEKY